MTILAIVCYFQGLRTCSESKEEISNFNKYIYSVYNFHWQKFEEAIFQLRFLKFTRKIWFDKVKKTERRYISKIRDPYLIPLHEKCKNWINFNVNLILHKYSHSRNRDLNLMRWRTSNERLLSSKRNLTRPKICTFQVCY